MKSRKQNFPVYEALTREDLRIKIPRNPVHFHTYGKTSEFFRALSQGNLLGTRCNLCEIVFLPPRADCPECWAQTEWVELPQQGVVATFAIDDYPGEGFPEDLASVGAELPCIIVYVAIPGVDTKIMSRLENCDPENVHIGMPVEARFVETPNKNCLDLFWVPV